LKIRVAPGANSGKASVKACANPYYRVSLAKIGGKTIHSTYCQ
jgi:hypothetical protein